jgi:hypothetical protein
VAVVECSVQLPGQVLPDGSCGPARSLALPLELDLADGALTAVFDAGAGGSYHLGLVQRLGFEAVWQEGAEEGLAGAASAWRVAVQQVDGVSVAT